MAGHSKWANIKHKKARADASRGKLWTKIIREITVAAKVSSDPENNPRLRAAMDKALSVNMPKDTIQRAVSKGNSAGSGENYDELRYEGYGASGIAVIVDCLTDNKTRTAAEVRHAFSKHGGNLGQDGSVAFMFNHCGQFIINDGSKEDDIFNLVIDYDIDDISSDDGIIELIVKPTDFHAVSQLLKDNNITAEIAELTMLPTNPVEVSGNDAEKVQKLLERLDDLDDSQQVYCNAIFSE